MSTIKNQLYYEKILLGEISGEDCDHEIVKRLKNSNNEILNKYNSKEFSTSVYFSSRKKIRQMVSGITSLCAMCIISLAVFYNLGRDDVRMKSRESFLTLYVKDGSENRVVEKNEVFKKGDQIQLTYYSNRALYGFIYSVDGDGGITLHYPLNLTDTSKITKNDEIILPFSYELDSAKEFEEFYFYTSDKEIDISNAYKIIQSRDLSKLKEMDIALSDSFKILKENER